MRYVRRMFLSGSRLDDTASMTKLAKFLRRRDCRLVVLDLSWCEVSGEGLKELCKALPYTKHLLGLNLEGNEINADGAITIGRAMKKNKTITNLSLSNNCISDTGAARLSNFLRDHPALIRLDLSTCDISSRGAVPISQNLLGVVTGTTQSDSGETVVEGNPATVRIEELILNSNPIGEVGGTAIADSLLVADTLKTLQLRDCDLSVDTARSLSEALSQRPDWKFEELDVKLNGFELDAQLVLNDISLSRPDTRVIWQEEGVPQSFEQEDIEQIVSHYEPSEILQNLLSGVNLLPLIDNHTLLTQMDVENEQLLTAFIENAFFAPEETEELTRTKYALGLEMLQSMLWRGDEPKSFLNDDFDLVEVDQLQMTVVCILIGIFYFSSWRGVFLTLPSSCSPRNRFLF